MKEEEKSYLYLIFFLIYLKTLNFNREHHASGTAKLVVNENTIEPNIVTIQNMPEIFLGYVVYIVVATG